MTVTRARVFWTVLVGLLAVVGLVWVVGVLTTRASGDGGCQHTRTQLQADYADPLSHEQPVGLSGQHTSDLLASRERYRSTLPDANRGAGISRSALDQSWNDWATAQQARVLSEHGC